MVASHGVSAMRCRQGWSHGRGTGACRLAAPPRARDGCTMPIAADYPFLEVFWTMILFFAWVAWIWMLVVILSDVFRRRDIGGWSKAAWCVLMIVVPFLGVLIYLIAQHDGIAQRNLESVEASERQLDQRIQSVSGGGGDGAADEIERAERLLARGTIDEGEFEALKAQALGR
jgi:hypothetical protein